MFKTIANRAAVVAENAAHERGGGGSGASPVPAASWLPSWSGGIPHDDPDGDWLYCFQSPAAYPDNASAGPPCVSPEVIAEECRSYYYFAERAISSSCNGEATVLHLLRWAKQLAVKTARSYMAFPLALLLLPLLLGITVGYWMGQKNSQRRERRKRQQEAGPSAAGQRRCRWKALLSFFASVQVVVVATSVVAITTWTKKPLSILFWCFRGFLRRNQVNLDDKPVQEDRLTRSDTGSVPSSAATANASTTVSSIGTNISQVVVDQDQEEEDRKFREELRSSRGTERESGVDLDSVPRHVAIIMDGNRRHGRKAHGNSTRGHWDGSRKLLEVAKWCQAERIRTLTVYAFSTENWDRDPAEVSALMNIFTTYCEELRQEALQRNIRVRVLSTDASRIPAKVQAGLDRLQEDTRGCMGGLQLNICLSYGGRGEIVNACRFLAREVAQGRLDADRISESDVGGALLTSQDECPDPDVLIRTSGEYRLSNFLLWQIAYTELFFVDKNWPEFQKTDLVNVIRAFAMGRRRRFGR
jgi:undecaprenyl diphosphate synthase